MMARLPAFCCDIAVFPEADAGKVQNRLWFATASAAAAPTLSAGITRHGCTNNTRQVALKDPVLRGCILDSNGRVLATSFPHGSFTRPPAGQAACRCRTGA